MSVDERALHALRQHLEEILGVDDAAQLVSVAVGMRDDLTALRREVQDIRAVMVTEQELSRQLARFATKDDLARFATKDDLARFATKDDLARFATSDQLVTLEERLSMKIDLRTQELLATVRGEFVTQLRAMFLGLVTVLVAIAGLGITLATTL